MDYNLLRDIIKLIEHFDNSNLNNKYQPNLNGFKDWICEENANKDSSLEVEWDNKDKGRSIDSLINTLVLHISRYAKNYSKQAIVGSEFSTQEEFIYLINLEAYGQMTKMDLIKRNIHEKPTGMLIINRLIEKGWVEQKNSTVDKRNKILNITPNGLSVLHAQMGKIREATGLVVGDLTHKEKIELVRILNKLNDFHRNAYDKNKQK